MDFGLEGKIALVVGGSRGSGLAMAAELAREGAAVLLTGRNDANVKTAVARIEAAGGKVRGFVSDLATKDDIRRIVDTVRINFGEPDILVANPPSPSLTRGLESISDAEYASAHQYYVMALVHLLQEVIPAMKAKGWGRIVNLGSIAVKLPHLHIPMYHQNTRVAAASIIKTASYEYAKYGITANTIAVGAFRTELAEDYLKQHGMRESDIVNMHPMGRFGQPEELAAMVAFLCSERASYVSGETLRVDGGASDSLF